MDTVSERKHAILDAALDLRADIASKLEDRARQMELSAALLNEAVQLRARASQVAADETIDTEIAAEITADLESIQDRHFHVRARLALLDGALEAYQRMLGFLVQTQTPNLSQAVFGSFSEAGLQALAIFAHGIVAAVKRIEDPRPPAPRGAESQLSEGMPTC